ncbi:MAG: tetraacyldisaccharide 4'-kinase [Rhodospirillaceae bacterium]
MRAPEFWTKDGFLSRALNPVGRLCGVLSDWYIRHGSYGQVSVPVISIGNLTVGGVGKTPIAHDIVPRLTDLGYRPAVVIRGYGGYLKGPIKVDVSKHRAVDVGDEALLHARYGMTWVATKRLAGAYEATKAGARSIILDDAHQHTSLAKDLSIVVVDGAIGFGNHRIIPAGPLRESISNGLSRADALVIVGEDKTDLARYLPSNIPILQAFLEPGVDAVYLHQRKVLAFAGIGRPEKFFATLGRVGARIVATHSFDDHYLYQPSDIQKILNAAFAKGALPVTTEKDAMRLTPEQRQQVNVLRIGVTWKDESALQALLKGAVGRSI